MVNAILTGSLDLESMSRELFTKLEEDRAPPARQVINNIVQTYSQRQEMFGYGCDAQERNTLTNILENDVIGAYDRFCQRREDILEQRKDRKWVSYLWKAALGIGAVVAVASKLKMNPGKIAGIAGGSLLASTTAYWIKHHWDQVKIDGAEKKFYQEVSEVEQRAKTNASYRLFRKETYGAEISQLEVDVTCSPYQSGQQFFADLKKLNSADPVKYEEFSKLNLPHFSGFIAPHLQGVLSGNEREARYKQMHLKAQEHFVQHDTDYDPFALA